MFAPRGIGASDGEVLVNAGGAGWMKAGGLSDIVLD